MPRLCLGTHKVNDMLREVRVESVGAVVDAGWAGGAVVVTLCRHDDDIVNIWWVSGIVFVF